MSFSDVMYGPLGQVNNMFQANLAGNAAAMPEPAGLLWPAGGAGRAEPGGIGG